MWDDAVTKLGAAAVLGVLLYLVLIRVGDALVAALKAQTEAIAAHGDVVAANTTAIQRVEAKLDHQLAIDRDRDARDRSVTPLEVPVSPATQIKRVPTTYSLPGPGGKEE